MVPNLIAGPNHDVAPLVLKPGVPQVHQQKLQVVQVVQHRHPNNSQLAGIQFEKNLKVTRIGLETYLVVNVHHRVDGRVLLVVHEKALEVVLGQKVQVLDALEIHEVFF